jgi:hypothetical protein
VTFTPNVFPTLVHQPQKGAAQILNATGTAQMTLITAGANGSKVVALYASSTDTAAQSLAVSLVRSATTYLLATVAIPAGSGNSAGTPPVNLLSAIMGLPYDQDGQAYMFIASGDTLVVNTLGTVTAAKTISALSDHGDF